MKGLTKNTFNVILDVWRGVNLQPLVNTEQQCACVLSAYRALSLSHRKSEGEGARNCAWGLTRRSEQLRAMERISFRHTLGLARCSHLDRLPQFSSSASTTSTSRPVKIPCFQGTKNLTNLMSTSFRGVMPRSLVKIYRYFGGSYCLHLQSRRAGGEQIILLDACPAYSSNLKMKAGSAFLRNVSKRLYGGASHIVSSVRNL
jgi:hypothetical protein